MSHTVSGHGTHYREPYTSNWRQVLVRRLGYHFIELEVDPSDNMNRLQIDGILFAFDKPLSNQENANLKTKLSLLQANEIEPVLEKIELGTSISLAKFLSFLPR